MTHVTYALIQGVAEEPEVILYVLTSATMIRAPGRPSARLRPSAKLGHEKSERGINREGEEDGRTRKVRHVGGREP